ncbi:MAG: hypothetical protein ACYDGY_07185 [Acidimicrobiales bacterium]
MTTTETTSADNHVPVAQGDGNELGNNHLSSMMIDRWSYNMIKLLSTWIVIVAILSFITVPWLKAGNGGDFTTPMIWFYHALMMPAAVLLLVICTRIFPLHPWVKYVVTHIAPVVLFEGAGELILGYGSLHGVSSLTSFGYWVIMPCSLVLLAVTALFFIDLAWVAASVTFRPGRQAALPPRKTEITMALFLTGMSVLTWIVFGMAAAANDVGISWNFWAGWQHESYSALMGNIVTAHSHGMLPSFMAGIVLVAAEAFGYSKMAGARAQVARVGVGVMLAGIALYSGIYTVSALGTFSIPAWFPFGPGGVNGLAMDDTMTGLVGIGALILAGAMLPELRQSFHRLGSTIKQRYNPVRVAVYLTYVIAAAVMFFYGYYIEMNESRFGFGAPPASQFANDQIFTRSHLLFVFGSLPVIAVFLIAAELVGNTSSKGAAIKNWMSGTVMAGMFITIVGEGIWVFSTPGHSATWAAGSAGEVLYIIGQALILVGAIIEVFTLRSFDKDSEITTGSDQADAELATTG